MYIIRELDILKALDIGLIPSVYFSDSPYEDIEAYCGNYLKEEISAEIKAKINITSQDYKGLRALKEEALFKNYILVSLEDTSRKVEDIQILPWKNFIENLWEDKYI